MKNEKLLPIGSVCMLKGGTKRVMITGFCSIAKEDESKIYDYSGCLYPEGVLTSDKTCLFDASQIEKVYFEGYSDDEEKQFKEKLLSLVKNLEQKSGSVNDENKSLSVMSNTAVPAATTPVSNILEKPLNPNEVVTPTKINLTSQANVPLMDLGFENKPE